MTEENLPTIKEETNLILDFDTLAYKLIAIERRPLQIVKRQMELAGFTAPMPLLQKLKRQIFRKADREMRKEFMQDNILDSYERVKIEFEDAVIRCKSYIEQAEDEGNSQLAMDGNKHLIDVSVVAMKAMGKLNERTSQMKVNTLNINNNADLSTSFKIMLRRWFLDMQAKVENGQLVFEKPSPELLDDFFKWENEKNRKDLDSVVIDGQFTDTTPTN